MGHLEWKSHYSYKHIKSLDNEEQPSEWHWHTKMKLIYHSECLMDNESNVNSHQQLAVAYLE